MSIVVYGDFTCPYSYLASRRTDALIETGVDVEWHAVEHLPGLPITGRTLDQPARASLEAEVAEVTGLLLAGEELPLVLPHTLARTEASIAGLAEAIGVGTGDDVRRLLFTAYWVDGVNIGDPEVLRTLLAGPILRGRGGAEPLRASGYAVSVSRGPITTAAYRRIRAWREGWARTGTATTPTVVVDGSVSVGVDGLRAMAAMLDRMGRDGLHPTPGAEPADPRRFPALSVHPEPEWVSTVGGPWARAFMSR